MVFTIMASLAQFESSLIRERVKAGMERTRALGKPISRPPISPEKQKQIEELWKQKLSLNQIQNRARVGVGTVRKYVHAWEQRKRRD